MVNLNQDITSTKIFQDGQMDNLLNDMLSWAKVFFDIQSPMLWIALGILLAFVIFAGLLWMVYQRHEGYK